MRDGHDRRRGLCRDQRGELLIETMITVVLLGACIVTALAALFSLSASSLLNQRVVRSGNEVGIVAEAFDRARYIPCATTASYRQNIADNQPITDAVAGLGSKYTLTVVSVEYLQSKASDTANFTDTCTTDQGAQRITIRVSSTATDQVVNSKLTFTKRDNRCPDDAVRPAEIVDGQPC